MVAFTKTMRAAMTLPTPIRPDSIRSPMAASGPDAG